MTILVEYENVTFNSTTPPIGSLIGAFYVNDDGAFSCAGYSTFIEDQFVVSIWGSESGLDNGFSSGENITWFIQVNGESFQASNSVMLDENMFSSTYQCNGFGQVNSLSFFNTSIVKGFVNLSVELPPAPPTVIAVPKDALLDELASLKLLSSTFIE